jgi:hypothetical protein
MSESRSGFRLRSLTDFKLRRDAPSYAEARKPDITYRRQATLKGKWNSPLVVDAIEIGSAWGEASHQTPSVRPCLTSFDTSLNR